MSANAKRFGMSSLSVIVHQMRLEAPEIVSLELRPVAGGPELPAASAGAHIDLHLAPGLVRSYSLVYPTQPGAYTVAVLKDRASRGGSRQVHEQLRVGQRLQISAPRNHFALHEDAPSSVLVAGGIGITPIYAMLQRLAELGRPTRLIYAARSARDAAYVSEIQALLARSPRLSVHWHWDDEQGGPLDVAGRIALGPFVAIGLGEDRAEGLRVGVGQAAGLDVVARILVALHIGITHTEPAQLIEFVVLAHPRESDAVVDLADLAQCLRRVLCDNEDSLGTLCRYQGATARDALAREVGPVLHQLFRGDVERHAHRARTSAAICW